MLRKETMLKSENTVEEEKEKKDNHNREEVSSTVSFPLYKHFPPLLPSASVLVFPLDLDPSDHGELKTTTTRKTRTTRRRRRSFEHLDILKKTEESS